MAEEIKTAPAAPAAEQKAPETKTTETIGQPASGAKTAPPAGNPLMDMLPMLIGMMIIFYLLLIRPENKRRKQQQMLGGMKKNDKVVLAALGMYGIVTDIDGDDVTLQIDPKKDVRITVRKEAIGGIVDDEKKADKNKK